MARTEFTVELGLKIEDSNGENPISVIRGSAIPGGTTPTDDALQSSLYFREDGSIYQKSDSGSGTDKWVRLANVDDLASFSWREEKVVAATGDAAPTTGSTIDLAASPFGDDEGTTLAAGDFSVGDKIIFGVGGTPKLMEVTAVSSPEITVADASVALSDNDMFIVRNYLPDSPDGQEKQAIVLYNGSGIIKISDFNWDIATGINLSQSYSAASGNVSAGDSVEEAIQKVDGVNDAQDSALGLAQGATNFGTFAGSTLSDNSDAKTLFGEQEAAYEETDENVDDIISALGIPENDSDFGGFTGDLISDDLTAKQIFQRLEDLLEQLKMKEVSSVSSTDVTLDEIPTSDYPSATWLVQAQEDGSPANRESVIVSGLTDGTIADDTVFGKLKLGSNIGLRATVDVDSGNMRLRVKSTNTTINVRARRLGVFDIA